MRELVCLEGRATVTEGWLGPSSAAWEPSITCHLSAFSPESRALEAARGQAAYHGRFQMSGIL